MGTVLDSHFLAITALVTVGYQFLFFVITAFLKFDKVTDFAGSSNFVILAALTLVLKGSWQIRQVVMTLLVVIWGFRLGIFLLMRILQWGEDHRFDEMRSNLGKLAVFWILQAVWVWSVSLPVTVVNATELEPSIGAADVIGWLMWAVGLAVEATADQQKLVFKNSPENRGKWCNVGIWKFSRHPNYFGELFLWWGVFVASTPILEGAEWLVILGPIFLTLLLLFVSGIPMLEASADKKCGSSMEYRHYKRTTSPLIPLPSVLYEKLPSWFKTTFLFELPLYSRNLPHGERLNCEEEWDVQALVATNKEDEECTMFSTVKDDDYESDRIVESENDNSIAKNNIVSHVDGHQEETIESRVEVMETRIAAVESHVCKMELSLADVEQKLDGVIIEQRECLKSIKNLEEEVNTVASGLRLEMRKLVDNFKGEIMEAIRGMLEKFQNKIVKIETSREASVVTKAISSKVPNSHEDIRVRDMVKIGDATKIDQEDIKLEDLKDGIPYFENSDVHECLTTTNASRKVPKSPKLVISSSWKTCTKKSSISPGEPP